MQLSLVHPFSERNYEELEGVENAKDRHESIIIAAMLLPQPILSIFNQIGFSDQAIQGNAPAGVNYRFVLTFKSEELRRKWVASDVHQKVWPTIENTLTTKNYTVLLFEVI